MGRLKSTLTDVIGYEFLHFTEIFFEDETISFPRKGEK
jgi:hypothetical protein